MFPSGNKDNVLYFPINGQFFKHHYHFDKPIVKANHPIVESKSTPKEIKEHIGLLISNYSVASWAKQQMEGLKGKTIPSDIPETSEIQLDTSSLDFFLPGIEDQYGIEVPVDLSYEIKDISDININSHNESVSCNVDVQMKFIVKDEVAVDLTLEKMRVETHFNTISGNLDGLQMFGGQEEIKITSLSLHVGSMNLNGLKIDSTTFGEIDIPYFSKFMVQIIDIGLPQFNKWLQNSYFMLPTEIVGGFFNIVDYDLKFTGNYLYL